ncbi:MAG: TlpA family protein disulfide reductase [Gemmatimonadetes bacterium]|nr:TlpA family protein disulfide reductase [Gemmatimonadota bacterium]
MSERVRSWLLAGVTTAVLVVLIAVGWKQRDRFAPLELGSRAPQFTAASLAGGAASLEDFEGRVVVLNFWATWCAPCRREMPALERLYQELQPQGLEVVAISVDAVPGQLDGLARPGGDVRAFVAELGLSFPVLLDPQGEVERRYGVTGLPTTFVIDRTGRVHRKVLGPAEWDQAPWSDLIRNLLQS